MTLRVDTLANVSMPAGWSTVCLGELFAFQNGFNAPKTAYGRGVAFANVLEVITNTHLYAHNVPGKVAINDRQFNVFEIRRGDVLFNRTSETQEEVGLASVYQSEEPMIFGGFVIRGRPKSALLDFSFSGFCLRAPLVRTQIVAAGQGGIRANIGQKDLGAVVVGLPPFAEQRAIAEALGDIDALIGALDALIAKKRDVKRGAMQRLLAGATRLPGFSEPWATVRLGSLARIVSGGTPRSGVPAYWNGGVAWCVPTDITGCAGKYLDATERTISAEGLRSSAATLLPVGTILLCSRATVGDARIANVAMATNQGFKSLIAYEGISGEFLYYLITTLKERMIEMSSGSTFLEIGKAALSGIEVCIPSDDAERQAIAAVLSDMDAEIEALEARRAKTADLKKGMMRDLLTGRVRLTGTGEKRAMEAAE